jgi:hypothetical protein
MIWILYDGFGIFIIGGSGGAAFVVSYWLVHRMPSSKLQIGVVGVLAIIVLWSVLYFVVFENIALIRRHPEAGPYPGYTALGLIASGFIISQMAWVIGMFLSYVHVKHL